MAKDDGSGNVMFGLTKGYSTDYQLDNRNICTIITKRIYLLSNMSF